ncbi:hypothetical protein E5K00_06990 [Hymenobacter aquaticus]|uniref:Uncharacterized protein n=1 Tax=Hymenobacter aquaticus TaxID=1867101 RepID=A0A4Z0Q4F2_9BACT|nr:hypothetical protein [Hymenobacter aquaticus]TGE24938.1 hypothetical protein E5K00_06990 [Hymenobacter aquaticus]
MALVIHITLALLLNLVRTRFSRPPQRTSVLTGAGLVRIYLSTLATRVILPYALGAALCLLLHVRAESNSVILLLPHFYMLLIRREILEFIQHTLIRKK